MLCSSVALSEKTAAAAIARPACTRCLRGHREEKRSSVARVSTVGARGSERVDFRKTSTRYVRREQSKIYLATAQETAKFKRLELHFQLSATRSASKEGTETAADFATHGSAPRSPYLPCQTMVQRKSSELEQNYGMFYRKI